LPAEAKTSKKQRYSPVPRPGSQFGERTDCNSGNENSVGVRSPLQVNAMKPDNGGLISKK